MAGESPQPSGRNVTNVEKFEQALFDEAYAYGALIYEQASENSDLPFPAGEEIARADLAHDRQAGARFMQRDRPSKAATEAFQQYRSAIRYFNFRQAYIDDMRETHQALNMPEGLRPIDLDTRFESYDEYHDYLEEQQQFALSMLMNKQPQYVSAFAELEGMVEAMFRGSATGSLNILKREADVAMSALHKITQKALRQHGTKSETGEHRRAVMYDRGTGATIEINGFVYASDNQTFEITQTLETAASSQSQAAADRITRMFILKKDRGAFYLNAGPENKQLPPVKNDFTASLELARRIADIMAANVQ